MPQRSCFCYNSLMKEICLCVIYNHNFEKNIPVLDRVYAGRFSNVYHIMPFYRGDNPRVIGVYESSYQFQGYIAQAAARLRNDRYSHYVFVADDMVINPILDERNIVDRVGGSAFVPSCELVNDRMFVNMDFVRSSVMNIMGQANACEWSRFLPSLKEAKEKVRRCGFNPYDGVSECLYRVVRCGCRVLRQTPFRNAYIPPFGMVRKLWKLFRSENKVYPLFNGYSDFCIVPAESFDLFALYCGVLAGCRVFVEQAIPTAMVLSCENILTLRKTQWLAENGVDDYRVRHDLEEKTDMNYKRLIENFPCDYLFIHPVKLSKWKELP